MKKLFFWVGIASFIAIGAETFLFQNQTGQILARVLVIVAVLANILSRSGDKKSQDQKPLKSTSVEVASLFSLIGGIVMAYLVFLTPINTSYRSIGILASTAIAAFALILANVLNARQSEPS